MRRVITGSLATLSAALVLNVAAASAADLLVLNGDPPVALSGVQSYGIVYVDGDLRLTGDTTIDAGSIYFGPDARIDSCYVAGSGDGQCAGGRSLTLRSSGPLTVATSIDLESGAAPGAGGSLNLSGTTVAVGGEINTSGDTGFPSGPVNVSSRGAVATQGIFAPGAGVTIGGHGTTLVGGGIQTQGEHAITPGDALTRMQPGGPVTINAGGGELDVDGSIQTQGQNAPAGGGSGAPAGAVTISGANVHTESIIAYGGGSQAAGSGPGPSAPVSITAAGALAVGGAIDTSGAGGANGSGVPGGPVTLRASGTVAVGPIDASGGPASGGAPVIVSGTTVSAGDINASGGAGSSWNRNGANASPISVTAPQGATLGALLATGGDGDGTQLSPAGAGAGSSITADSSGGSISVGRVESEGGAQGVGPGSGGGPISLRAAQNLTVAGDVRAAGSDAGGTSISPWSGGNASAVFLAASTGTMTLGGDVSAQGGSGSPGAADNQPGGQGGAGARVTLIAHDLGLLVSLSAAGGAGGGYDTTQGPGGPGGSITAYTDAPVFNNERWVSSDGGDGKPAGAAGSQTQNAAPTALSFDPQGRLSFTPHSPDATGYQLVMVEKGGATKVLRRTTRFAGLRLQTPVCQAVELEVLATSPGLGWISDPSTPIRYERPPSRAQSCSAPAQLLLGGARHSTVKQARRTGWVQTLRFHVGGVGSLSVTLDYRTAQGRAASVQTAMRIRKPGNKVLHLRLPGGVHAAGSGIVTFRETSPDGKHHRTRSIKLTVSA